jgi:hypothetical protein
MCPGQVLGPGAFDVADRPGPDSRYDPQLGHRIDRMTGTPVCVHPYRVGLPPGRYASAAQPLPSSSVPVPEPTPAALELPDDVVDLEGWLVAVLKTADPSRMASALHRAEAAAAAKFPVQDVVVAMRRVLAFRL